MIRKLSVKLYKEIAAAMTERSFLREIGMGKVFFSNSGAEANECAVKAARKYAAREKHPRHRK